MTSDNRKRALRHMPHTAIFGALVATFPAVSSAARLDYELSMRYMHSDNIALVQDNVSENILSPQVRFRFTEESSAVTADFSGAVQYLDYLDDTFDDDARGEFSGDLEWKIVPERITLYARDTLSEQSVDSLAAFTPGNQQQINVFEGGPTFLARFNETTQGQLDLRYINSWAEETESLNSDRYNIAARMTHLLSETSSLALNAEAGNTEYDNISELYNYKRYDLYATYQSELAKLELSVDAGYSRLEPEDSESFSSALFRGYLRWKATARSSLGGNFDYQFGDSSQDLIRRVGAPGTLPGPVDPNSPIIGEPDNPNLQIIPDTFRQERVSLTYEYTGERLRLLAEPYYEQLRYLRDDTFDVDSQGFGISGLYNLRPRLDLTFVAQHNDREFVTSDRSDSDLITGAGLAYRFTRHWGAQFDYRYRKRNSSVGGQDYVENLVVLSISYFR
ncbi:hypothetical protein CSC70_10020 [Pseudoxanthomonas kalamensis DSM 18571]|uniref:outer membrane beta-barrel protein n=1 Tax=Pseudoxanthomonas kalamensis TaxID=289483 RepID=UPI00139111C7|nr:outer membrane beta-barrel protein [Pseudoxanthomonas kalamensis]KAF1710001.1 hypothetical protein CSC70_10020 [Pseudoxanthomonas kalamensis DSM 18571]